MIGSFTSERPKHLHLGRRRSARPDSHFRAPARRRPWRGRSRPPRAVGGDAGRLSGLGL